MTSIPVKINPRAFNSGPSAVQICFSRADNVVASGFPPTCMVERGGLTCHIAGAGSEVERQRQPRDVLSTRACGHRRAPDASRRTLQPWRMLSSPSTTAGHPVKAITQPNASSETRIVSSSAAVPMRRDRRVRTPTGRSDCARVV